MNIKSFHHSTAKFCFVCILLFCLLALDLHPVVQAAAGLENPYMDLEPNVVTNGSFETPIVRSPGYDLYRAGDTFGGWTVEAGSIDHISKNLWQASDGLQSVDLTGSPGSGTIYQDLPTVPQETYQLSLDLAGNPNGAPAIKQMEVWWGPMLLDTATYDTTGNSNWNMGWSSRTYKVTATTAITRLRFKSLTAGYFGPALDNVHVQLFLNTDVFVAGTEQGSHHIPPHGSIRVSYAGINSGPVKIINTENNPMIAAERVIYKVNNIPTSYSEMMGLPNSQLDTTYWLPWYNNFDLDTQLRIANVSSQQATVRLFIGGQEKTSGCTPSSSPYTLAAGASLRVSCAAVNAGPVQITSTQNIVAAERMIYKANGVNTSFIEMMALPNRQLSTTYWLPWYNNADLDTQLRFANVTNQQATVRLYIAGQEKTSGCIPSNSPYSLAAGASLRVSCTGVNNGPVQIVSTQNIVAAERVIFKANNIPTSFAEMMAVPDNPANTTYWLPWYNNVDLDTQLRFANVSDQPATVRVFIGGVEKTSGCTPSNSPYNLAAGASLRVSCAGVNNGPVEIRSDQQLVAAERVIYKVSNVNTSFTEMMGLPDGLLDTTYWFPWYNNKDLDTQLRFGVP